MFDSIGGGEIMLILLAILVLFGPKRIPDLAQSLGKGLREFKKAQQDLQDNLSKVVNSDDMKGLHETIQGIHADMQSSVQKLTADLQSATAAITPAPSVPPATTAPEPVPAALPDAGTPAAPTPPTTPPTPQS